MTSKLISTIARVECRSEGREEETPIAVVIGTTRFAIVDIIDRAILTSADAGAPIRHRLWVELDDGRKFQLTRLLPKGDWRVAGQSGSG